jgi:hypothetical protein
LAHIENPLARIYIDALRLAAQSYQSIIAFKIVLATISLPAGEGWVRSAL